jgi:hypothetical protein
VISTEAVNPCLECADCLYCVFDARPCVLGVGHIIQRRYGELSVRVVNCQRPTLPAYVYVTHGSQIHTERFVTTNLTT